MFEIIDEVEDPEREDGDIEALNRQGKSYGIISKLLEFRAKVAEPRMSLAILEIRVSLVAGPLEPLPIFLEGLFSARRNQMLKHVYQCVKVMIQGRTIEFLESKAICFEFNIISQKKNCH